MALLFKSSTIYTIPHLTSEVESGLGRFMPQYLYVGNTEKCSGTKPQWLDVRLKGNYLRFLSALILVARSHVDLGFYNSNSGCILQPYNRIGTWAPSEELNMLSLSLVVLLWFSGELSNCSLKYWIGSMGRLFSELSSFLKDLFICNDDCPL